ncbi:hypothetical protein B0J12DRAFT_696130 [Macrophomina phaseolina]|uniref:Uncharacterized protein n=1 Tax=Macrophomina phaseolina TaxID=35725 RepID=A0ABQ8GMA5_9PEZI|nr:hypothetical protein B0J12DRAFT_696130 [Macrophomina phaseolina]
MATTYCCSGTRGDGDDIGSGAPLLPHEITANRPAPTQPPSPPQLKPLLGSINTATNLGTRTRRVPPLAQPHPPPAPSALEPFPPFDLSVGPSPPPTPPPIRAAAAPPPPHHNPAKPTNSQTPGTKPPSAAAQDKHTDADVPLHTRLHPADFLPLLIRCHTLLGLAARVPPAATAAAAAAAAAAARAQHLAEAKRILCALEHGGGAPAAGRQMIELSTGRLWGRLRELEEGAEEEEAREVGDDDDDDDDDDERRMEAVVVWLGRL